MAQLLCNFSSAALKLRWLNVQCYEVVLPNGKVILFDPQFSDPLPEDERAKNYKIPEEYGLTRESVERVDYLIVNHTHCDHIIDLEYFVNKFHPMLICQGEVAFALAKAFRIPFTDIFAIGAQEHYEFEDFTLDTIHGQHMPQTSFTFQTMPNIFEKSFGVGARDEYVRQVGMVGSLFSLNYVLTTRDNLKIAFFAGRMDGYCVPGLREMAKYKPNVLIRQIPAFLPDKNTAAELFVREFELVGAQLMLPMHHEAYLLEEREIRFPEFFETINRQLSECGCAGRIVNPVRGQWYEIWMGLVPV